MTWWIVDKRDRTAQRVTADAGASGEPWRFVKVEADDVSGAFRAAGIALQDVIEPAPRQPQRNIYQDALDVQDACNLSGVVYSWAKIMDVICEEDRVGNRGTDWKNKHPVNVLFASKVADMTGSDESEAYFEAARKCREEAIKRGGRG